MTEKERATLINKYLARGHTWDEVVQIYSWLQKEVCKSRAKVLPKEWREHLNYSGEEIIKVNKIIKLATKKDRKCKEIKELSL